jgi:hypothetical protein
MFKEGNANKRWAIEGGVAVYWLESEKGKKCVPDKDALTRRSSWLTCLRTLELKAPPNRQAARLRLRRFNLLHRRINP